MKTELQKVFKLARFFNIQKIYNQSVKYSLKEPSTILLRNIYSNWLHSIWSKTHKNLPVYLNDKFAKSQKLPFGVIQSCVEFNKTTDMIYQQHWDECVPEEKSYLVFNLIVPGQDSMQYFIQWQRYRKYWWSSITTTPSLFSVDDINHGETRSSVNIVAKFPWGAETVETLNMKHKETVIKNTSQLTCKMSLEGALFILLLDGIINRTKEGYLRLHRNMAPFQLSFALENGSNSKATLEELAILLHNQLADKNISTWIPDFSLDIKAQLAENLQMGVAYTAILSETTLSNGIFHLLNSSTMLKEQIHIADFNLYAAQLCGKTKLI